MSNPLFGSGGISLQQKIDEIIQKANEELQQKYPYLKIEKRANSYYFVITDIVKIIENAYTASENMTGTTNNIKLNIKPEITVTDEDIILKISIKEILEKVILATGSPEIAQYIGGYTVEKIPSPEGRIIYNIAIKLNII